VSSFAVAMAREHQLNRRIETILAPGRTLGRVGIWARLGVTVSCIALAAALIACQGARVYKVAQLTIPPRVVSKIEPQYSQAARDAKLNGTVTLSLVITPEGRAEKIRVTKGFDGDLDRNAVAAIEQWRFSPGQKDGKPVHAAAVIDVNYHLE
jgi:TonB family protein